MSLDDDGIVVPVPFTYIIRCADDALYVGHTDNLARREQAHNEGRGALFTATRRPVRVVYFEEHSNLLTATRRERQLKKWNRDKKEALVAGDLFTLRHWSQNQRRSKRK